MKRLMWIVLLGAALLVISACSKDNNGTKSGSSGNVLQAPNNLVATAISTTEIALSWTDTIYNLKDGFKIERKTGAAGVYAQIVLLAWSESTANFSYQDVGLTPNTDYYYRIKSFSGSNESVYSNEAQATTIASPAPPGVPSGLSTTVVSSSQVDLRWSDNSNNEDGFRMERKVTAGGTYVQINLINANVISCTDSAVSPTTTYYYRVCAFNALGNSGYSEAISATTFALSTAPTAPSGLNASVSSATQINLSWIDNSSDETAFIVEWKLGPTGVYQQLVETSLNITNCVHAGLVPATIYYYRVKASNLIGGSEYSNEVSAATQSLFGTPNAPSVLTTTSVTRTQVNLSWTDNSTNEIGFVVEWKIGAGGWMQLVTTGPNITSCAQGGLTANTTYYYRVKASNAAGSSVYSNELSVTTSQ